MDNQILNLLSISQEILQQKNLSELSFFIAHQSFEVIHYRKSIVFSSFSQKNIKIHSISDEINIDKNTPFTLAAISLIKNLIKSKKLKINKDQSIYISEKQQLAKNLQNIYPKELDEHFILSLFFDNNREIIGGILFFNDDKFLEKEIKQFQWLYDIYQYSWQVLFSHEKKSLHFLKKLFRIHKVKLALVLALIIILLFPVKQSVMAEAEVIAKNPTIITSPIDGVIDQILVKPNELVKPNTLLVKLNTRDLEGAYLLSEREYQTAEAKYQQAINTGFQDIKYRAEINVLKSLMQEKKLEADFTKKLLNEANIQSPNEGIAIINDPFQWRGKPVQTGEKILEIANPNDVEIKIWLPVNDALNFKKGDQVKLFLNNQPLSSINATVLYAGINAEIPENQILAYPITASFDQTENLPRIGSQGQAKIYGNQTVLFFYLFRKPITFIRQYLGW